MIYTIAALVVDYIIHAINNQIFLSYHSVYIALLVMRLWLHLQPEDYTIRESSPDVSGNKKKEDEQNSKQMRICQVCEALKPDRYYHCKRCEKCIYRMDHHCNWISNCIGQFNSKVYLHLLVHMFIHSLLTLVVIAYNYASLFDVQQYAIYYLIDFIPALYAGYETYRLISDFLTSVKKNQTLIESYKKVHGKQMTFLENWKAYMGSNIFLWFLPTFQSHQNCDLLEKVIIPGDEEVIEYDDPEDYIYGPLEQFEQEENKYE